MKIVVGITGASGTIYALRLLEELNKRNVDTSLIVSKNAKYIIKEECNKDIDEVKKLSTRFYENDDLSSPLASGSFYIDAMVVIPCSIKTLSAIANGYADTLISRASINCLKEERKLILVPRETPLDLSTIKNMLKAKQAGATILPAMPAFYHHPKSIDDMVNFVVGKVLDQLGIRHHLFRRWRE